MAKKKDPPRRKVGPESDEPETKKKTAREVAGDLKERFDKDGVQGVMQGLAPFLDAVQKAATEAGNAAAAAGASAVERAKEKLGTTTCSSCGTRIPLHAKFCLECGVAVPREKHCSKCGISLTAATRFCPDCGTKA